MHYFFYFTNHKSETIFFLQKRSEANFYYKYKMAAALHVSNEHDEPLRMLPDSQASDQLL